MKPQAKLFVRPSVFLLATAIVIAALPLAAAEPAAASVSSSIPKPVFAYDPARREAGGIVAFDGTTPSQVITRDGRQGLNFTSIRGRAGLPQHTAASARGTAAFWVLPLQDCAPATQLPAHGKSNSFYDRIVFLSDREAVQEIEAANFCFLFDTGWYPALMAKFGHGTMHQAAFGPNRIGMASAGYLPLHALHWYHLAVTWDHETHVYVLYVNGVKVGHSDTMEWPTPPSNDQPAPWLYFGSPTYAMGDISFYDQALTGPQLRELFQAQAKSKDREFQPELEKMFEGRGLPPFDWKPDASWHKSLALPLKTDADYEHFFQQGSGPSVRFIGEGMRITTPGFDEYYKRMGQSRTGGQMDMTRMYLWTRQVWQGDLYVTVEFQLHQHGGLALLMAQAAGMQGEDFLNDYPLRSDGSMSVVHREDVRNYHWEFYREMADCRNDLVTHGCFKNPWLRPMAFQVENRHWELGRWYRLEFLQQGPRIRGAIDGVTVIDAMDTGFDNNGPVLRHGRVALRAMMRTDMTFRDLEIWTHPDFVAAP
ncbi:MAG: DUF1961 family protein [Opitutaceae bacterium]|jgi:hypothetical protein